VLFLLDMYLGVELLGHRVISCLTFWRIVKLCSKAATPFYITIKYESFSFSKPMTMFVLIILIMVVPVCDVIFHYGFDLGVVMPSILCVYWSLAYFLWIKVYSNSFLIWIFLNCSSSLYSGNKSLTEYIIGKCFLPLFLHSCPWCTRGSKF